MIAKFFKACHSLKGDLFRRNNLIFILSLTFCVLWQVSNVYAYSKISICTDGDGYSEDENKTVTRYDSLNHILNSQSYSWNGTRYVVNGAPSVYTYDSDGNLLISESPYDGISYSYDSLNNVIEEIHYYISNAVHTNTSRKLYSYILQLRTQVISQNWNNNLWQNTSRIDYHYFQNNLLDSCQNNFSWTGQNWLEGSRTFFNYHPNEKLDMKSYYTWRSLDSTMNISGLDTLTYDSNWLLTELLHYSYNDTVRNPATRNVYGYDSNGYQNSSSEQEWDGSSWTPIFWSHSTKDVNGNILHSYGSCYGCGSSDSYYVYDSKGRLSHSSHYSTTHGGLQNNSECDIYYREISGPEVMCEGSSITLSADTGFVAYSWSTGETTRSILVDTVGTYSVSMMDSSGFWDDAAPTRITVSYGAVAPHAADSSIIVCRNQGFQLSVPVNPAYSYQWIYNDNYLCNTFIINGSAKLQNYPVNMPNVCFRVVVSSGCDVDTSSKTCVQFSPDSLASITATGGIYDSNGRLNLCKGDTLQLTASHGSSYKWYQTSETSQSIKVSKAGTYYVYVYDSSGCYSSASITVDQQYISGSTQLVAGDSLIFITPSYNSYYYSKTWLYNGDTISNFHGDTLLHPLNGYYQTIITYPNICPVLSFSNIFYYHQDSLMVNAPYDPTICYGAGYGTSIGNNISIQHGTAPYSYQWSPSLGLSNPNSATTIVYPDSLIPGQTQIYILTVTDSSGKVGRDSVFVDVIAKPVPPIATILNDDTICNNQQYIQVQLSPPPGIVGSTYSVSWVGGCYASINQDYAYLHCGGTYYFSYVLNGCRSMLSAPIVVNSFPSPGNLTISTTGNTTFCYGDSVLLQAAPHSFTSYQWNEYKYGNLANSDTTDLYIKFGESWRIIAIDSNGCKSYSNWTSVNIDTVFQISINYDAPSVVCAGDSVRLSINAAAYPAYAFHWLKDGIKIPNENDSVLYAKETGRYSMLLYPPGAACAGSSQSILVQIRPLPFVDIIQNNNQLEAITSAWNYQWYRNGNLLSNDTNQVLALNSNGLYKVEVVDYHGCAAFDDYLVNCSATINTSSASCFGVCDAMILATTFGISPFSYNWSSGDTTQVLSNVCQGNYTLIISDTLGCSDTVSTSVSEPAILNSSLSIDSALCYNDCSVVHAIGSGGTAPYTYLWCDSTSLDSLHLCGIQACTIVLLDQNGCSTSPLAFTTVIPDSLTIVVSTSGTNCIGCSDGTIFLQVNGGMPPYSFSWSPNVGTHSSDSIIGLSAGYYNLNISDRNNCVKDVLVLIDEDPTMVENLSPQQNFSLYPNPAHEKISIELKQKAQIRFFNSYGQVISEAIQNAGKSDYDLSAFAAGFYSVQVISENNNKMLRLIVQ